MLLIVQGKGQAGMIFNASLESALAICANAPAHSNSLLYLPFYNPQTVQVMMNVYRLTWLLHRAEKHRLEFWQGRDLAV
jgi:hypothetical protein